MGEWKEGGREGEGVPLIIEYLAIEKELNNVWNSITAILHNILILMSKTQTLNLLNLPSSLFLSFPHIFFTNEKPM